MPSKSLAVVSRRSPVVEQQKALVPESGREPENSRGSTRVAPREATPLLMLVTERPEVCYYVKVTVGRPGSEGVFAAVWRAGLPADDPASLALSAPLLVLVIAFAFSCDRRIAESVLIGNTQDGGSATSQNRYDRLTDSAFEKSKCRDKAPWTPPLMTV